MLATIPAGLTIRPATFDDFESVLQLIAAQNMTDYGEPMISADDLRELWQSANLNLAKDTWVAIASDGNLTGYAELWRHSPTQFAPSLYVATEYQGTDLGVRLLQLAETRAASSSGGTPPISLTGRVSEYNQMGKRTFESASYTLNLSFWVMEIVMTESPESAQWAAGITVRGFIFRQDEQATFIADEEASEDKGYHKPITFEAWAKRMSLHTADFDPTLWFLACSEDEIVGVALNFYSQATDTVWIDHLAVRQPWRNRGVGKALLLHSFAEFYRRGIYRVKLSVDSKSLTNAPRLYEHVGMRTIQQYHIYRKELNADKA